MPKITTIVFLTTMLQSLASSNSLNPVAPNPFSVPPTILAGTKIIRCIYGTRSYLISVLNVARKGDIMREINQQIPTEPNIELQVFSRGERLAGDSWLYDRDTCITIVSKDLLSRFNGQIFFLVSKFMKSLQKPGLARIWPEGTNVDTQLCHSLTQFVWHLRGFAGSGIRLEDLKYSAFSSGSYTIELKKKSKAGDELGIQLFNHKQYRNATIEFRFMDTTLVFYNSLNYHCTFQTDRQLYKLSCNSYIPALPRLAPKLLEYFEQQARNNE